LQSLVDPHQVVPEKRVFLGVFIHKYAWGWQIRGDERGYIEKVKRYRDLGVQFFTLEKNPSLQASMGENSYSSLNIGRVEVPPRGIGQLLLLTLRTLRAALRRYPKRPVAIYAYNQDIENIWPGYMLKLLVGARLVVVYHHLRPASFMSFRSGVADRLGRGFHPLGAISKSILPALTLFAARQADVSIALSAATRDEVSRLIGVEKCAVVGNGVDSVKFRPMGVKKEYEAVFLGRLAPQKGVDVLLRAWKDVTREQPAARLVLLGGGEAREVSFYKKMAYDLGISSSVKFAGFVEDEEIVRAMGASKLFVFPSRKEGFAQAVSQAMACGLCCILSDIPPLREVYGGAAEFVPVDQPRLLARAIVRLLGAEVERADLGKRARRLAEGFSWERAARSELSLIEGMGR
jgi:glycosyltransferase involved in cell wall biosynthesis